MSASQFTWLMFGLFLLVLSTGSALAASSIDISAKLPTGFQSNATLTISNRSQSPRAVLVKVFNGGSEIDQVSEVTVNVPAQASVSVEAEPIKGAKFANQINWRYYEVYGKFVTGKVDNDFQLPFPPSVNVQVCQSADGPITTHQDRPNALDFCAKERTPITAAQSGTVIEAIDTYTEGGKNPSLKNKDNKIVVMHDDGLQTYYGHIFTNSAQVKIGDKVEKGQVLARVGNVGYSDGPHLHFEVREVVPRLTQYNQLFDSVQPNFVTPSGKPIRIQYKRVYNVNGQVGK